VSAPQPKSPLLEPELASTLLDEVIYEQVLNMIDLDGLFHFEQELWSALNACGLEADKVPSMARAMIDRALRRIPEEPRRYLQFGKRVETDMMDCALCEEEARRAKRVLRSS